jgi:hypothetical protein
MGICTPGLPAVQHDSHKQIISLRGKIAAHKRTTSLALGAALQIKNRPDGLGFGRCTRRLGKWRGGSCAAHTAPLSNGDARPTGWPVTELVKQRSTKP